MEGVRITAKAEKFEKVKEYLSIPYRERMPLPMFRKEHKIKRSEYIQLKADAEQGQRDLQRQVVRNIQETVMSGVPRIPTRYEVSPPTEPDIEEDPVLWWKSQQKKLNEAILSSAMKGNAQSQKLAKQLAGELVEKQEVKIGLTADERAARLREANAQTTTFRNRLGHGVAEVSS